MTLTRHNLQQLAGSEQWNQSLKKNGDDWVDIYKTQTNDVTVELNGEHTPPSVIIRGPTITITDSLNKYHTLVSLAKKYGFIVKIWDSDNKWNGNNASFTDSNVVERVFTDVSYMSFQPCLEISCENVERRDVKHYVSTFNKFVSEYEQLYE